MIRLLLPDRPLTRSELVIVDCATACLLAETYLATALSTTRNSVVAARSGFLTSIIVVLLMALPLAARRIRPIPVLLTIAMASAIALALGILHEPFIAVSLACYTAASGKTRLSRRGSAILVGASLTLLFLSFVSGMVNPLTARFGIAVPGLALVGAAWTFGAAVRERRAQSVWRSDVRIAQAIGNERLRIAHEVHDIVTHNLGVITVKAAVAGHVGETNPDEMIDALHTIEEVGRAALAEMRQILQILRSPTPAGSQASATDPPLGTCDLEALRLGATAAGMDLQWKVTGTHLLAAGTTMSTYRILQEALTNVLKHAGPTRCEVAVDCTVNEVVIDIQDDGAPAQRSAVRPAPTADGYGLIGMRERVAMYGGELTAGPRREGGFRVHVRLALLTNPWVGKSSDSGLGCVERGGGVGITLLTRPAPPASRALRVATRSACGRPLTLEPLRPGMVRGEGRPGPASLNA